MEILLHMVFSPYRRHGGQKIHDWLVDLIERTIVQKYFEQKFVVETFGSNCHVLWLNPHTPPQTYGQDVTE
jgi:hypothetical protein